MRNALTCLGFAVVIGSLIGCGQVGNGPKPVQQEIPPHDFGKTDPMPTNAPNVPNADGQGTPPGKASAEKPEPVRAGLDKVVRIGDVQVRINSVRIGNVPLKSFSGTGTSEKEHLILRVEISNANATRKYGYKSWNGGLISFDDAFASVKDNFGNRYKRITFGFSADVIGAVEREESLYPNKSVSDVLVFERPLDSAKYLDVDLPAKNFGGEGTFYFRIALKNPDDVAAKPKGQAMAKAKPESPPAPPVIPLDLDLPPVRDTSDSDGDRRPLPVRRAAKARSKFAAMQAKQKDFDGPREHAEQLEAAVAAWSKEADTTYRLMLEARDELINNLKPRLQTEAEAKFPSSKTDLKIRARAESQQTLYVRKKLEEETARLKAEYKLD